MKERLKEIFSEIAEQYEFEIEEMSVQKDHVHLFVSAPPRYSPRRLADILEGYILAKDEGRVSQAETTPLPRNRKSRTNKPPPLGGGLLVSLQSLSI